MGRTFEPGDGVLIWRRDLARTVRRKDREDGAEKESAGKILGESRKLVFRK
jgi:hypothetical protein